MKAWWRQMHGAHGDDQKPLMKAIEKQKFDFTRLSEDFAFAFKSVDRGRYGMWPRFTYEQTTPRPTDRPTDRPTEDYKVIFFNELYPNSPNHRQVSHSVGGARHACAQLRQEARAGAGQQKAGWQPGLLRVRQPQHLGGPHGLSGACTCACAAERGLFYVCISLTLLSEFRITLRNNTSPIQCNCYRSAWACRMRSSRATASAPSDWRSTSRGSALKWTGPRARASKRRAS